MKEDVADIRKTMATKEYVQRVEADMKHGFAQAKEDVQRLDTDMQNGFAELRPLASGYSEETI